MPLLQVRRIGRLRSDQWVELPILIVQGTHGTGLGIGNLATLVVEMDILDGSGEVCGSGCGLVLAISKTTVWQEIFDGINFRCFRGSE